MMIDLFDVWFVFLLCSFLLGVLLCCVASQIKNLNHNLYLVFKANGMIGDISEDSILFTKLDKKNVKFGK